MAIATAEPRTSYDEWRDRRWRLTGLACAILWLVVAAAVGLAGERVSHLRTLEASIADGSVTQVEIVGLREDADGWGRTTVTLKWRKTLFSRYADVLVDGRRKPGTSREADRIVGDPADHLRAAAPDLRITYAEPRSGGFLEWRGWRGPGWAVPLGLAAWFATFLLAGCGPEPWRATRWGWGWPILLGGPIGCLAYLLLGGPLGLWRPKDVARRLTGGWSFLLTLLAFGGANAG